MTISNDDGGGIRHPRRRRQPCHTRQLYSSTISTTLLSILLLSTSIHNNNSNSVAAISLAEAADSNNNNIDDISNDEHEENGISNPIALGRRNRLIQHREKQRMEKKTRSLLLLQTENNDGGDVSDIRSDHQEGDDEPLSSSSSLQSPSRILKKKKKKGAEIVASDANKKDSNSSTPTKKGEGGKIQARLDKHEKRKHERDAHNAAAHDKKKKDEGMTKKMKKNNNESSIGVDDMIHTEKLNKKDQKVILNQGKIVDKIDKKEKKMGPKWGGWSPDTWAIGPDTWASKPNTWASVSSSDSSWISGSGKSGKSSSIGSKSGKDVSGDIQSGSSGWSSDWRPGCICIQWWSSDGWPSDGGWMSEGLGGEDDASHLSRFSLIKRDATIQAAGDDDKDENSAASRFVHNNNSNGGRRRAQSKSGKSSEAASSGDGSWDETCKRWKCPVWNDDKPSWSDDNDGWWEPPPSKPTKPGWGKPPSPWKPTKPWKPTPKPNGSSNPPTPTPPNYNYCGSTFADANSKCGVSCYDGTDAPCPVGTHCFADAKSCPLVKPPTKKPHPGGWWGAPTTKPTTKKPHPSGWWAPTQKPTTKKPHSNGSWNPTTPPPTSTPPNYNYCGTTFETANSKCGVTCYDGTDAPCPVGTRCFSDAKKCPLVKPPRNPTQKPTTKQPHSNGWKPSSWSGDKDKWQPSSWSGDKDKRQPSSWSGDKDKWQPKSWSGDKDKRQPSSWSGDKDKRQPSSWSGDKDKWQPSSWSGDKDKWQPSSWSGDKDKWKPPTKKPDGWSGTNDWKKDEWKPSWSGTDEWKENEWKPSWSGKDKWNEPGWWDKSGWKHDQWEGSCWCENDKLNDHKPSWGGDNHWKRFSWSGKSDWKPSRRRTLNDRTDRSFRNSDKSKDGPNSSKERSMSDWMPGWMPGWMPEWKPTYNYCGSSLDDANSRCGVSCYDGADASCPTGEQCYTNAKKCPLVKPDGWSGGVNHVNIHLNHVESGKWGKSWSSDGKWKWKSSWSSSEWNSTTWGSDDWRPSSWSKDWRPSSWSSDKWHKSWSKDRKSWSHDNWKPSLDEWGHQSWDEWKPKWGEQKWGGDQKWGGSECWCDNQWKSHKPWQGVNDHDAGDNHWKEFSPTPKPTFKPIGTKAPTSPPTKAATTTTTTTATTNSSPIPDPTTTTTTTSSTTTTSTTTTTVPPPTVSPTSSPTVSLPKFSPNDLVDGANFGSSIDMKNVNGYGKTAIIGAHGGGNGVAYVFDFNDRNKQWEQVGEMLAPGVKNEAKCGRSVAIYDTYYFVGCPEDDEKASNAGSVYVYQRQGSSFTQQNTLYPDVVNNFSAYFGWSLAANANGLLAIGARIASRGTGAVWVYSGPDSNQWVKREQLTPPVDLSLNSGGNFGWDVAMDDSNTVFVGAPNQKTPDGEISGAVYTYKQVSVDSWGDPSDDVKYGGAAGDEFGWSVAANSEGFVVGAPDETVEGVVGAGAAHVFINDQTSYRLSNSAPETSGQFGFSVFINQENSNYLNVGGQGGVYVYKRNPSSGYTLVDSAEVAGNEFGSAVAMSGSELLVGAPGGTGSVYYYHIAVTANDAVTPRAPLTTETPSISPTFAPTADPTFEPTYVDVPPTTKPTPISPQTDKPTEASTNNEVVTSNPTTSPSKVTSNPTPGPTTSNPTYVPTYTPTEADDGGAVSTKATWPPSGLTLNPIRLSIPEKRYTAWSSLSETDRTVAQVYMGYTQETWDIPGSNEMEGTSYVDLDNNEKTGVKTLLGLTAEKVYDCHINHYHGYWWADLVESGYDIYYALLGWNEDSWDNDGDAPNTEDMYWNELTIHQKVAAGQICYFRDLWDGISIPEWEEMS